LPAEYITINSTTDILSVAQGSSKIYSDFANGRAVDIFPAAVRAGTGGSYAWTAQNVIDGLNTFIGNYGGSNLLLYANGGGVENVGVSRAINEMLCQAPEGKYIQFFPMWPQDQSASFHTLLLQGGFLVSANYNSGSKQVENVQVTAAYTLNSASSSTCTILNPWSGRNVNVVCGGNQASVKVNGKWFSFTAPKNILCAVSPA